MLYGDRRWRGSKGCTARHGSQATADTLPDSSQQRVRQRTVEQSVVFPVPWVVEEFDEIAQDILEAYNWADRRCPAVSEREIGEGASTETKQHWTVVHNVGVLEGIVKVVKDISQEQ